MEKEKRDELTSRISLFYGVGAFTIEVGYERARQDAGSAGKMSPMTDAPAEGS